VTEDINSTHISQVLPFLDFKNLLP